MKIAVVGTGISGMTAASMLCRDHQVTVFEADDYVGGHTHTIDVELASGKYAVDTGFIVFNDRTYPNFIRLLDDLGVASKPTTMSFGVRCLRTGLEYSGSNLNTLFAQRRNLIRPGFYAMLRDILRFNREAAALLDGNDETWNPTSNSTLNSTMSLNDYLVQQGYGEAFIQHYIIPMGAAIWSSKPVDLHRMPVGFFVRFFRNHGLLSIGDRPQWRVVTGGSRCYMERLGAPLREHIRLSCPVRWIRRYANHVQVMAAQGPAERFDQVVIAAHSDQALGLLADPSAQEQEILGAVSYQENKVVVHTDTRILPRHRLAWAAWNYHIPAQPQEQVALTYNMNLLQGLGAPETLCVTLNYSNAISPEKVLAKLVYHHPVFTRESVDAQRRRHEISGVRRTWYCGAYWGYGFHEDGVNSALAVAQGFAAERVAA